MPDGANLPVEETLQCDIHSPWRSNESEFTQRKRTETGPQHCSGIQGVDMCMRMSLQVGDDINVIWFN